MHEPLPPAPLDRTFAAIVLDETSAAREAGAGAVRERVEALRGAGVHVLVVGEADAADVPRARAACSPAGWLAERGITGGLVVVAGDGDEVQRLAGELPRAPVVRTGILPLLDEQLERIRHGRVPSIDDDPDWVVPLPADGAMARASEALGTLANGWSGTRGAIEEDGAGTASLFVVSGVYTADEGSHLLAGPPWTLLEVPREPGPGERALDLRTGVLVRTTGSPPCLRTMRFASITRPHALGLRAEADAGCGVAPASIAGAADGSPGERDRQVATTSSPGGGGITVAAADRCTTRGRSTVVERLAAWGATEDGLPARGAVTDELSELVELGFDVLLAEHRAGWAQRWAGADVEIEGAPADQLAARFAVFHLLSAAPDDGELALGARGLTGPAYGGHVFWDADVFVLPALAALRPTAARAMLEYRLRRLPAARAAARALGRRGARFPWESAVEGFDVTPATVRGPRGELIAVRTGEHEEHIVADVAWAACEYARWSGDARFLRGPGRDLVLETARWWASRIRHDSEGRGHLYGVMGPDEYHEVVDDNAYTNVMARWNLRRAADLRRAGSGEADRWRDLAASLVDGYDHHRGLYEQFAGYWALEPLLVADVAEAPVAADVLLGAERVAGSQIIKQADVLMLHHLLPDEAEPGSLAPNLAHYEPRTAHGSSLSPAIHAALFARAGQPDRALDLFRLAARLDLDDITGTTSGGLHLATIGGVWQALAYGFLGLRPDDDALRLDPCLPAAWRALGLRFRYHGSLVHVRAEPGRVIVDCATPLMVRIGPAPARRCDPPGCTYDLEGGRP